ARAAGLHAWLWEYDPDNEALATGSRASRWVMLSAGEQAPLEGWWEEIPAQGTAWTDDFSNLLGAIDLRQ
ncbi:MAG: hypothetical protein HKO64_06520, partial [Xanthomonadales bacterium]|nr:hypothetical protein [Xanthomonadales bacterium]